MLEGLKPNDVDYRENPRWAEREYAGVTVRNLLASSTIAPVDASEYFGAAIAHHRRLTDEFSPYR